MKINPTFLLAAIQIWVDFYPLNMTFKLGFLKLCTYIWRSSICKKDLHFSGISHPSDHHDHRGSATKMINGGAAGNKFRTGQRQRMHLNDSRSQQPQQPQSLPPYPVSILPTGQMAYQF